jgi:hypothetical protein
MAAMTDSFLGKRVSGLLLHLHTLPLGSTIVGMGAGIPLICHFGRTRCHFWWLLEFLRVGIAGPNHWLERSWGAASVNQEGSRKWGKTSFVCRRRNPASRHLHDRLHVEPTPRNPYAAPSSVLEDKKPKVGSSVAVVFGAAIGNGIAYTVLSGCGLVFLWVLVAQGVPTRELYSRAYQSNSYLIFAHVVGLGCLLPGGYWTARLSREGPIRNAGLAGILISVFSLTQNLVPYNLPIPFWSRVASAAIPIPAFLLGALYWRRVHHSSL